MNRVSIVVPVYNSSRFLDECIYSIRTQTYKNIEIIVIDDGSTDESVEIIRKHALEDERIKCYSQKNRGVAVARNKGIQLSTSELLMFVDSDDTLFPNSVEILAQHSDCDFIMGGYEILNMENGEIQVNSCPKFWGKADKFFMNISMYLTPPFLLSPCFKLFKKSIIKSYNILFPERMNYGEDAEFVLSYCEHIKTVCCENRSCYSYRKYGTDSLSSKFRVDKLAINNRINDHIISDILLYGNNNINSYVVDVVSGIFKVLFNGLNGEVYNIANENSIASIAEVASICAEIAGTNVVFDLPDKIEKKGFSQSKDCILDNSKLKSLGWNGKYTLKQGLVETIESLREDE